jgi:hypothetical protein
VVYRTDTPYLLRLEDEPFLVLFGERQPACQLAATYQLDLPECVLRIEQEGILLGLLKLACEAGAKEVWIDPRVDEHQVHPQQIRSLAETIEAVTARIAMASEVRGDTECAS